MEVVSLVFPIAVCVSIALLGFLVLGLVRQLGLLKWRIEQLEATTPSRIGRDGLRPGTAAPAFTLEDQEGTEVSLRDFADRRLLLVFTQPDCGPCEDLVPELNALHEKGEPEVVAISNGEPEASRVWTEEHDARFPVLCQEHWKLSRRYEVFVTPFAFLVDGGGVIRAKGIVNSAQHIRFLLASARDGAGAASPEPVSGDGKLETASAQ